MKFLLSYVIQRPDKLVIHSLKFILFVIKSLANYGYMNGYIQRNTMVVVGQYKKYKLTTTITVAVKTQIKCTN